MSQLAGFEPKAYCWQCGCMRLMNEVLKDFIGKFLIVYLDDILVFSNTRGEHLRRLKMVLRRFQQEKMMINMKK
jgi:hypothetical protein